MPDRWVYRHLIFLGLSLPAAWSQTTLDKPAHFLVKLGNAVGSKVSHPGDRVTAVIVSPERFLGGRLIGSVDILSAGSDGQMSFTFRQASVGRQHPEHRFENH